MTYTVKVTYSESMLGSDETKVFASNDLAEMKEMFADWQLEMAAKHEDFFIAKIEYRLEADSSNPDNFNEEN